MKRIKFSDISRLGLSIAEFTRRSGIAYRTLRKSDSGEGNMREDTAARIWRAFKEVEAQEARRSVLRQPG